MENILVILRHVQQENQFFCDYKITKFQHHQGVFQQRKFQKRSLE
jgi:hypothetical protein